MATGSETGPSEGESSAAADDTGTTGHTPCTDSADNVGDDDPVTARDDGPYAVRADQLLIVDWDEGVLVNDQAADGSSLVVVGHDGISAKGGLVSVETDGSFSYQPPADSPFGTDRFHYMVANEQGDIASAEARVAVQPANAIVQLGGLYSQGLRILGWDSWTGHAVSGAGDVNGDGHSDLLLGAPKTTIGGVYETGQSYLILGEPYPPSVMGVLDAQVRLPGLPEQESGTALSGTGDVNGDGLADFLIGSRGASYLIFGRVSFPSTFELDDADARFVDVEPYDGSGTAVSGAGDVNGDGYADLLIGAYVASPGGVFAAGQSYLVFGSPSLFSTINLADADVRFDGIVREDRSGAAVSGAGDVNGDGYADLLIGAYAAQPDGNDPAGEVYLMFGGPDLPSVVDLAEADVRFVGSSCDNAGFSVSGVGDVNGDGHDDILIGAPQEIFHPNCEFGPHPGRAYLVLGRPTFEPSVELVDADVHFGGIGEFDQAGTAVSGAGDVNGDGFADLLIGSPSAGSGWCHLVLGRASFDPVFDLVDAEVRFDGITFNDRAGQAVGTGGDVNGDGFDDLLIGARSAVVNGVDYVGEGYVVFGDDLSAKVSILGSALDDDLTAKGGSSSDIVVGGCGADVLRSDGGADVLRGGEGDDILMVGDGEFFRIDGGLGVDTLELRNGMSLSLMEIDRQRIVGIERVRFGSCGGTSLSISELELVNISETSNVLTVEGGVGDEVVLAPGNWLGPVPEDGYVVYTSSTTAGTLRIESAVSVVEM